MSTHRHQHARIRAAKALLPAAQLVRELPCSAGAAELVVDTHHVLHRIVHGKDDRLVVIVGPCSIHDPAAALDYAERLVRLRQRLSGELEILMRVYFEKPRTTVGWKGLINDPRMDGSFDINEGLRVARRLLLQINELGLPTGTEFLDLMTPYYLSDLVSWGAIGARTTESQVHREMASGLACPIGFKNGTDGNVKIAIDAIGAASQPHHFLSSGQDGSATILSSAGNEDCHIILRGGKTPNYDAPSVEAACAALVKAGLPDRVMVDASHANSSKKHENQIPVCEHIGLQIAGGDTRIFGVMIESNLVAGRQDAKAGCSLVYGQSVTDACIDWDDTERVLEGLARAVIVRRDGRHSAKAACLMTETC